MLATPFLLSSDQRQKRSFAQEVISSLKNVVFQCTNPLPFETGAHTIHTIPLIREHCDSFPDYIQNKALEITSISISNYFYSSPMNKHRNI